MRFAVAILIAIIPECVHAEWKTGVELAMNRDSGDWGIASLVDGEYLYGKNWRLSGKWGFISEIQTSDTSSGWKEFKTGNPLLVVDRRQKLSLVDWSVGLGLAAPLAALDGEHDRHGRTAYAMAAALFGLRDLWLWAPDRLGIVIPASAIMRRDWYELALDSSFGALIPLRNTMESSGSDLITQFRFTALVMDKFLKAGTHIQTVGFLATSVEHWQSAIAPFVGIDIGRVGFNIETLFPLDAPLANQNLWSLHLVFKIRGL